MTVVAASAPVKPLTVQLPPDHNYRPPHAELPAHQLPTTNYRPEREHKWKALTALLPMARRAKLAYCGVESAHAVSHSDNGTHEYVCPISCTDRIACEYCAMRYESAACEERHEKLFLICDTLKVPLYYVEARFTVPQWIAAVKQQGCDRAEASGRLCNATGGCTHCAAARVHHRRAADIEKQLQNALMRALAVTNPGCGGVYVTKVEYQHALGTPEIVVRFLLPAALNRWKGKGWVTPTVEQLKQLVAPTTARLGCTSSQLNAGEQKPGSLGWMTALIASHAPAFGTLMLAGGEWTVDGLRTAARAIGLAVSTVKGTTRRAQRTAWFGCLTGRKHRKTIGTWGIIEDQTKPKAEISIVDRYITLSISNAHIEVVSKWTGEHKVFPRGIFNATHYVTHTGAPIANPDAAPVWSKPVSKRAWDQIIIQHFKDKAAGKPGHLDHTPPPVRRATKKRPGVRMANGSAFSKGRGILIEHHAGASFDMAE